MFKIVDKVMLGENVAHLRVFAPEIAAKGLPGQFVILRHGETGERIPLTLADWDQERGIIDLVVQAVGLSTMELAELPVGGEILDVAGPLGTPAPIENIGSVWCIAGGIGAAPIYPQARAYHELGNRILTVQGARHSGLLIFEDRLRAVSDEMAVCTEDGSFGQKGRVTEILNARLEGPGPKPNRVVAIGPVPMMRAVCEVTRPYGICTLVSLNALMIDGTGMCGGCRVTVGGEVRFACVDGPDFDGHRVDFDELQNRQKAYLREESRALSHSRGCRGEGCSCRG